MAVFLARLFEHISSTMVPNAFSYIPQMYLETFIDSFHAVRRSDPLFDLAHGNRPTFFFEYSLCG